MACDTYCLVGCARLHAEMDRFTPILALFNVISLLFFNLGVRQACFYDLSARKNVDIFGVIYQFVFVK